MHRTFGWLTAGLIVLGVHVAGAQEKPDPAETAPDTGAESNAQQRTDRRVERRELRRSGELPAARPNAAAAGPAGSGIDVAVPGTGVDVNGARGAGGAITAAGVGVTVPPAGSGAGIGVNVPAAGIHATVNPNAWRYRWHNNRWWFYHPNNRWSFWNNNRWNAYRESNTATANHNPETRRFSNSPRYESGYRGVPSNDGAAPKPNKTDKSLPDSAKPGDGNVAPAP